MPLVFCRQHSSHPFAKVAGAASQIDCYIEYFSLRHSYQFSLRVLNLVMQAPQYISHGTAVIVLDELHVHTCGMGKVTLVETLKKETATVGEYFRFKD